MACAECERRASEAQPDFKGPRSTSFVHELMNRMKVVGGGKSGNSFEDPAGLSDSPLALNQLCEHGTKRRRYATHLCAFTLIRIIRTVARANMAHHPNGLGIPGAS